MVHYSSFQGHLYNVDAKRCLLKKRKQEQCMSHKNISDTTNPLVYKGTEESIPPHSQEDIHNLQRSSLCTETIAHQKKKKRQTLISLFL